MPADVIINPGSGEIYWNDNAGSPQSISIRGDAQNKIDIIGYSASFSPGSSGVGTFVIATFNDSVVPGTAAFAPGTNGNELGSAILRWKPYLTTTTISDSASSLGTNSTTLLTGVLQVNGGIAISGNASVGQTLLFWTPGGLNYIGFRAPASAGNTTYVLPSAAPVSGATGTSVLSSDTSGVLSWIAMSASSSGAVTVSGSGTSTIFLLGSNLASGSGLAVSANSSLFYNSATQQLTTPFLYSTYSVGSEGGEIVLNKPASGSGLTTTITIDIQADRFRIFETGGANRGFYLDFSTDSVAGAGKNIIGSASFATTSANVNATFASGQSGLHQILFTPNTTTASGIAVSFNGTLTYNPVTDVLTSVGIAVTGTTASTNQATGALQVAGGLGVSGQINAASMQVAGNVVINGNLQFNGVGTFGNNAAIDTVAFNARFSTSVNPDTDNAYDLGTSALGWRNFYVSGIGTFNSGLRSTSNTNATSTSSGSLSVTGGVGIGGNAFIGGTTNLAGINVISNSTSSTSTGTGSLVNVGGFGNLGNVFIGGTINAAGITLIANSTNTTSTTTGSLVNVGGFGLQGNAYIGGTVNITSTNQGAYGSTTAGALVVAGTVGVGLSMYIAGQLGVGGTLDYNATGNIAYFAGNTNSYNQVVVHNHNSGNNASSDFIVSNDSATDTTFFGDFGMNSSGWAATTSAYNTANAVYLVSNSGDLALGSLTTNAIRFFYNNSANDAVALGAIGMTVYYGTSASSTGTGALQIRGGIGITGNAFIGGTSNLAGAVLISDATTSTSSTTGSLIVSGGVGIGGSLNLTTAVPSSISGLYVFNGVLSGTALTALSLTTTNIRTTASTLNIVDSGTSSTVLNYNGSRFAVLIASNSSASNNGGLVVTGGAGFGATINVAGNVGARAGFELRAFDSTDVNYTGFRFTGAASTTYILPTTSPATGSSVLQSTAGGVMSWVPMATGSGSPAGNNSELQFNSGGTFAGATGITYQPTTYLVSIASTADQRAVTTVGLRLVNNATVSAGGVQQRYSPALEIAGKTWTSPTTENFNRFLTEVFGTIGSYGAQQQWKYSLDTGTPTYTNPLFIIHSQKGVGIGRSSITFQSFFLANASQAAELTYVLPVAYPGTGTSVLSSDTTGNLSWVPATTGGSGTPGGSSRQIQYNSASSFGGATGFEYVSAGNAVTVSYFSGAGGGNTVGMVICAVNATTTRVGIGLTNPAYELEILGEISATNKSFVIEHPTKPGKKLRYGSLEGPENGVYCRGILHNENIIETPDHWTGLVDPETFTVTLTPIGRFAQLYVIKIEDYKVYIADAQMCPINCYYTVWAERKDIPKLVTEY